MLGDACHSTALDVCLTLCRVRIGNSPVPRRHLSLRELRLLDLNLDPAPTFRRQFVTYARWLTTSAGIMATGVAAVGASGAIEVDDILESFLYALLTGRF